MYVVPFVMGHLEAEKPMFGVELTDSAYVVVSMLVMARTGTHVLRRMEELDAAGAEVQWVPALHSVGMPLEPGQADVAWPCNETKYIVQFPEERAIWSFGSGYGGNALLGKKCYALRIASVMARDEGWLAEHMLILKLTSPQGVVKFIAAAFPSACGKTNLAMLRPTHPGLEGRDPRRRHRLDAGRRRRPAVGGQPRVRLLRRRAGHQPEDQPQRDGHHRQGQLGVHQRRPDRGRRHLVGGPGEHPGPGHQLEGRALDAGERRALQPRQQPLLHADQAVRHPRRRVRRPAWRPDRRDPVRRPPQTTVPLVFEARDWTHGTFLGATLSSETTAAAIGAVGVVRRDPMAMLPFIGYNAGHYFNHWITVGKDNDAAKLPKIFYVNWFRRDDEGDFLWPGFGENSRVLKWVVERIEGQAAAVETPIGHVPTARRPSTSTGWT